MPADIFAALGALVRAEAARNLTRPHSPPPAPVPPQDDDRPAPRSGPATSVPPQGAPPASPSPAAAPSAPVPAPTSAASPRGGVLRGRRPLRAWRRLLRGLVCAAGRRRRRAGSTEGEPAPDA
ncbi:hypothetical protein GCM10017688_13760 [Streptomyces ramulosus]